MSDVPVSEDTAPSDAADPTDPPVEPEPAAQAEAAGEPEPAAQAEPSGEAAPAEAAASDEAVDAGPAEYEYVQTDGEGEDAPPEKKAESPYDRPGRWYAVHTQSGYEKKARQNLQARINSLHQEDTIYEVIIPMEDVVEFKAGKKVVVQKKMLPGYMLVRCRLDDDAWRTIRDTPGITGFVGPGNKPAPLTRKDVEGFMAVEVDGEEQAAKRTKPRFEFELHESVRVTDGPFADFTGEIVEINEDQLKVKVLVNIFGRETPVELEFSQIAKL
jgi:transcriptional antiterminator NusG